MQSGSPEILVLFFCGAGVIVLVLSLIFPRILRGVDPSPKEKLTLDSSSVKIRPRSVKLTISNFYTCSIWSFLILPLCLGCLGVLNTAAGWICVSAPMLIWGCAFTWDYRFQKKLLRNGDPVLGTLIGTIGGLRGMHSFQVKFIFNGQEYISKSRATGLSSTQLGHNGVTFVDPKNPRRIVFYESSMFRLKNNNL